MPREFDREKLFRGDDKKSLSAAEEFDKRMEELAEAAAARLPRKMRDGVLDPNGYYAGTRRDLVEAAEHGPIIKDGLANMPFGEERWPQPPERAVNASLANPVFASANIAPEMLAASHRLGVFGSILRDIAAKQAARDGGHPAPTLIMKAILAAPAVPNKALGSALPPVRAAVTAPVQMKSVADIASAEGIHQAAALGTSGSGHALPFLDQLQKAFGRDLSGIQAHTDSSAADGAAAMGAKAYATGNHVVFGDSPDLHTVAHEVAHVLQQQDGVHLSAGVGAVGDDYERRADAIADRVVAGQSAVDLLAGAVTGSRGVKRLQTMLQSGDPPKVSAVSALLADFPAERHAMMAAMRGHVGPRFVASLTRMTAPALTASDVMPQAAATAQVPITANDALVANIGAQSLQMKATTAAGPPTRETHPPLSQEKGKKSGVFAENGLPYLIQSAGPLSGGDTVGVWVVNAWIDEATDLVRAPKGSHRKSLSRAHEILQGIAWIDETRRAHAEQSIIFDLQPGAASFLRFRISAYYATGLPKGSEGKAARDGKGGLDVVIATGDDSLAPGVQTALSTTQLDRAIRVMETFTGLQATANGIAFLGEEFQELIAGNGTLLLKVDKVLGAILFDPGPYDDWLAGKNKGDKLKDKKLKLENYYGRPIPGALVHHGDLVENNENIWFEVQVAWPKENIDISTYQIEDMATPGHKGNVALLKVEWEFERIEAVPQRSLPLSAPPAGGVAMPSEAAIGNAASDAQGTLSGGVSMPAPAAAPSSPMPVAAKRMKLVTASTDVAEVRHALALEPGESVGTFRVTAHARFDAYFEPATFSTEVTVKSTTAMMQALRDEAFAAMPVANEKREKEEFNGLLGGSGSDIHGERSSADLPADFVASPVAGSDDAQRAVDPRSANRTAELDRLKALKVYLQAQGSNSSAIEAVERDIKRLQESDAKLKEDRDAGWQAFEIRGTYLAREEGIPSGPLVLYGSTHISYRLESTHDGNVVSEPTYDEVEQVTVQIRDMSRRFESIDMTFIGNGTSFDAALRSAFLDLAKAYPNGMMSIQAEQINADALARPEGHAGARAAGAKAGTGKTIGFELGTDSRWKRVKAKVFAPVVNVVVNIGAIAMMALVPGSAVILMPALAVYNSVPMIDDVAQKSARGTLTLGELATSAGAVALNFLPFVGRAKVFTAGWYLAEGLNWGGQAVLMTATSMQQAAQLQSGDVAELVAIYEQLQTLEKSGANPAVVAEKKAALMAVARKTSKRIEECMAEQVATNAMFAIFGSAAGHVGKLRGKPAADVLVKQLQQEHIAGQAAKTAELPHGGEPGVRQPDHVGADAPHVDGEPVRGRGAAVKPAKAGASVEQPAGRPGTAEHDPLDVPADVKRRPAHVVNKQAIAQQVAGPGHAQTDLHSHFMGNVAPDAFARELATSGKAPMKAANADGASAAERVGDVSSWEPLLREIAAVNDPSMHHKPGDKGIGERGTAGDALELAKRTINEIRKKKLALEDTELAPEQRANIVAEIDTLAKSVVEKSLRASDETDFNSGYEIRDDLLKKFYGTAARRSVIADGESITSARAKLDAHFASRPAVRDRIAEVVALETGQAAKTLTPGQAADLAKKQKLITEQFAYDKYTQDTLVRLAQDNITYTEQSNSVNKLKTRFDEGQLKWAKERAKLEHPELAAQLDALEVKHIAMITTDNYGDRNADVSDIHQSKRGMSDQARFEGALQDVQALMQRSDVIGMDVAGMEHYKFNKEGQQRFVKTYDALYAVAQARGEPVILRPHVGEGAIDTTPADPFHRDGNRQVTPQGELTHYERARDNIDAVISSLDEVVKRPEHAKYNGRLPPNVIVRFGHATHTTPAQAAQLAKLGVIVEVNLGSNRATGSVAKNKPVPGQPDVKIGRDQPMTTMDESTKSAPTLDDHSLATLIYNDVDIVLSTDGHDVMNTTMGKEFELAKYIVERIKIDKQPIRISAEQANAMNAKEQGGHAVVGDATGNTIIEVKYSELSPAKKALFDQAYQKFYETAQRYVAQRPKAGDGVSGATP